jgi:hypothetical protein
LQQLRADRAFAGNPCIRQLHPHPVADLGRSRVTGGLDLVCCLLAVVVMHCVDGHLRRDADGRRTGGAEPVPACMRP